MTDPAETGIGIYPKSPRGLSGLSSRLRLAQQFYSTRAFCSSSSAKATERPRSIKVTPAESHGSNSAVFGEVLSRSKLYYPICKVLEQKKKADLRIIKYNELRRDF